MFADDRIPASLVSLLVQHGHLDVVRREAQDGNWNCADALGRVLLGRGEVDAALDVYRPFTDPGRFTAATGQIAEILGERGDVDAAIVLVRPFAEACDRNAVHHPAVLLARQERIDDMVELLRPGLQDW